MTLTELLNIGFMHGLCLGVVIHTGTWFMCWGLKQLTNAFKGESR